MWKDCIRVVLVCRTFSVAGLRKALACRTRIVRGSGTRASLLLGPALKAFLMHALRGRTARGSETPENSKQHRESQGSLNLGDGPVMFPQHPTFLSEIPHAATAG